MVTRRDFEGYTVVLTPENLPITLESFGNDAPWMSGGACIDADPADFDVQTVAAAVNAKAICGTCPVALKCLTYAIEENITTGVWGGATPGERGRMKASGKIAVPGRKRVHKPRDRRQECGGCREMLCLRGDGFCNKLSCRALADEKALAS